MGFFVFPFTKIWWKIFFYIAIITSASPQADFCVWEIIGWKKRKEKKKGESFSRGYVTYFWEEQKKKTRRKTKTNHGNLRKYIYHLAFMGNKLVQERHGPILSQIWSPRRNCQSCACSTFKDMFCSTSWHISLDYHTNILPYFNIKQLCVEKHAILLTFVLGGANNLFPNLGLIQWNRAWIKKKISSFWKMAKSPVGWYTFSTSFFPISSQKKNDATFQHLSQP